jgi:hypothetical protein
MSTVVVAGALANKAGNGGAAWVRLSYLIGFRRLGLDVAFVEQIDRTCYTNQAGDYFDETLERFDLARVSLLVDGDGLVIRGADDIDPVSLADDADLLVNVGGNLRAGELLRRFRRKAFVDLDPGFTQVWASNGLEIGLAGHDVYFTIGENIGGDSLLPTMGIDWQTTRPPVVLEEWPVAEAGATRFTTVGSWRGPYGSLSWKGKTLGPKAHEFRKFLELPQLTGESFELALEIEAADQADLELLEAYGWRIVDPGLVAATPDAFRTYVQGSGGEFSVAQGIYVETQGGWFSDRSARYLASGKPALVQDTGSSLLRTGEGMLTFRTVGEAVAGIQAIASNRDRHARAARTLAETLFDSDEVLGRLLHQSGVY